MISSILFAVVLAFQTTGVQTGYATWYGDTTPGGPKSCFGGYRNTCSPYVSKANGGRGGELIMYAAVPGFRYTDKPYKVAVCLAKDHDRCVVVTVRDCLCSKNTKNMIDLSPRAFLQLAPLSRGRIKVVMEGYDEYIAKAIRFRGR